MPVNSGEVNFRNGIASDVISMLSRKYPEISRPEIKRIYHYVQRYCEIKNGNQMIPFTRFTSRDNASSCSIFWIKNKLTLFFDEHKNDYNAMTPLQILEKIVGEEEYNSVLNAFAVELNDEDIILGESENTNFKFEEVDGGTRRTRTRGAKRRTNNRLKKNRKRRLSKRKGC
jgi:hypothetical protein